MDRRKYLNGSDTIMLFKRLGSQHIHEELNSEEGMNRNRLHFMDNEPTFGYSHISATHSTIYTLKQF